jgi:hypothetical protein
MDGGAHNAGAGGEAPTRASTRVRKVAKAMAHLDSDARANAAAARLEALEQDNAVAEPGADDSGDEYVLADDLEGACRTRAKRQEWEGTDSAAPTQACVLAPSKPRAESVRLVARWRSAKDPSR